jgi:hypothetical protein
MTTETNQDSVVCAILDYEEYGQVISGDIARTIASYWQSSGTVGHVLASFASGRMVSMLSLKKDILRTLAECVKDGTTDDNMRELHALLAYTKRH